jgi:cysteinyl-tRNA synthetase
MKIFNSLSKKNEEFVPITPGKVSLYSCGPTVYNNLHIGNLAAFIYADVLRRTFTINGYEVKHVMNTTDVDDKTIRDSKVDYPDDEPHVALKKLTDKYTEVFLSDMKSVGNSLDNLTLISAVETIPEMIILTQKLLDNDIAYVADDGVYFSITKYYQSGKKYGVLQNVATQQSKARIVNDEYDKESAADFALWKRAEVGEPSWEAKFTEDNMLYDVPGRPGWHIECSAMSEKKLGVPFDVHTGGIDLKFPHHENEIAQTCAAGAEKLANYFFHNNYILIDSKKMSKSLGNFYTLRDLENKGFKPICFRLLVLESHYHSESNFSWDIMTASTNRYKNWINASETMWQLPESKDTELIDKINYYLSDNMNTPLVLREIDLYFESVFTKKESPNKAVIKHIDVALGIDLNTDDLDNQTKILLAKRADARAKKDWELSDSIRDDLIKLGINTSDSSVGQIWSRIQF